jgi:hypothetical protein
MTTTLSVEEITRVRSIYHAVGNGVRDPSCSSLAVTVHDAFMHWYGLLAAGVPTEAGLVIPARFVTDDVALIIQAAEQIFSAHWVCTGQSDERIEVAALAVLLIEGQGGRSSYALPIIGGLVICGGIVLGVYLGSQRR